MRNRWNVDKHAVLGWSARLDEGLLVEVLRLAEEYDVHTVWRAPEIGYDRGTDSRAYPDVLAGLAVPDRLAALSAAARTVTRVAYATPDGGVVEDEVSDLGAVATAGEDGRPVAHRPALRFRPARTDDGLDVRIQSYSDIWLPWCSIRYERHTHVDDLADNRELATRHTPRLNAFLARVAELARGCGGALRVDPDHTDLDLAFQVDADGVRLDAADPRERTAWASFGEPTGTDLADALLTAAVSVERDPPPAPYRAAVGAWSNDPGHPLSRADRDGVRDALRAARVGSLLSDSMRVKVQTGRVRHTFEPGELAP